MVPPLMKAIAFLRSILAATLELYCLDDHSDQNTSDNRSDKPYQCPGT